MKKTTSPSSKLVSNASELRKRLSKISDEQREIYLEHALSIGKKKKARASH